MADDLTAMLDRCASVTQFAGESAAFLQSIVDALESFRGARYDFTEKTDSWASTAGNSEYLAGEDNMPGDVQIIDEVTLIQGGKRTVLKRRTRSQIRRLQQGKPANGTPRFWTQWRKVLLFDCPTVAGLEIELDYVADATLNEDGDKIDPTDESVGDFTNAFFTGEGAELLEARAVWKWALGRGNNPDLAMRMKAVGDAKHAAMVRLRDEPRGDQQAGMNF